MLSPRKVLITGVAGFIGFHLAQRLLRCNPGVQIVGVDNLNPYYDVQLKKDRLSCLVSLGRFDFFQEDVAEKSTMDKIIACHSDITHVVHLAAQAGVRHSLTHPFDYIHTNLVGFFQVLEATRRLDHLQHFLYASSSSVYGNNQKHPFSEEDTVASPLSLYAATKQSNELMAYAYNHAFGIPCTGLRFFTVYGPWGRPDMAIFMFLRAILTHQELVLFNNGDMWRSFTYIDDIIDGVMACLDLDTKDKPCRVYNLGGNEMRNTKDIIKILEQLTGEKAIVRSEPHHVMDVPKTMADLTRSEKDLHFYPKVSLEEGLCAFVKWYQEYKGGKGYE